MNGTHIHPTAVIDPSVEIGAGVFVGPYCVVNEGVTIGDDCWLQHHVSISGPTKIGAGNKFYGFDSIGLPTQDLKYAGEPTHLDIGENNSFREFISIHRGTAPHSVTKIGNGGHFLAYTHIAHDCIVGDNVIFSNNGTLAGHVHVEDHVMIGGLTAIHQFCRIGRYALTGGCSKIVQDVPPFMLADGNPARVRSYNRVGLERHGFAEETMRIIKEAYRLIYRSRLNLQQAIEQMRSDLPSVAELEQLIDFISNSPRGIIK
jgi:UDP-N-acetylglucosamine acyltransferase